MEHFRVFEKEPNQNWLRGVVALFRLQKPLERFIDEEIGIFHRKLVDECGADLCEKNCNLNNWKPQPNQVANGRNNIMHAARFQLKQEDLLDYLNRTRKLGEMLEKHVPELKSLSKDIDEIQSLDYRLILLDDLEAQKIQAQDEKELEDIRFAPVEEARGVHCPQDKLMALIISGLVVGLMASLSAKQLLDKSVKLKMQVNST
ncbi:uncharacterized protein [Cebidichthys violaceus]|uniref:uncharacterized protein n=1 Tax=Cebidichthys violaceus TaxID=271503 RepID=UPI0035C97786